LPRGRFDRSVNTSSTGGPELIPWSDTGGLLGASDNLAYDQVVLALGEVSGVSGPFSGPISGPDFQAPDSHGHSHAQTLRHLRSNLRSNLRPNLRSNLQVQSQAPQACAGDTRLRSRARIRNPRQAVPFASLR